MKHPKENETLSQIMISFISALVLRNMCEIAWY